MRVFLFKDRIRLICVRNNYAAACLDDRPIRFMFGVTVWAFQWRQRVYSVIFLERLNV